MMMETADTAADNNSVKTTEGDELTNVSTCSLTQASSERDAEDYYADVGFLFDGLQTSTLKRFTWGNKAEVKVALHVVDDEPCALQSGHRLWPAAPALAEYLIETVLGSSTGTPLVECLKQPHNVLELGAGSALLSLTALQLLHESLQCVVVTDHDPGTLERARDNYETTLEDLLESTQTEEEQFDCINGLASVPVMFEALEWGDEDTAKKIATAAAEHGHPLLLEETTQQAQSSAANPNHNPERNVFDLLLGSDLIYCETVVKPLFSSVSYFMSPGGSFLLAQSSVYDEVAERNIEEMCETLKLQRIVLKDDLNKEEGGVRIQQFQWKSLVESEEKQCNETRTEGNDTTVEQTG